MHRYGRNIAVLVLQDETARAFLRDTSKTSYRTHVRVVGLASHDTSPFVFLAVLAGTVPSDCDARSFSFEKMQLTMVGQALFVNIFSALCALNGLGGIATPPT